MFFSQISENYFIKLYIKFNKMMVDIPNFKRCCVCLPLRYGLLIWSYLIFVSFGYILMYVFPLEVTFSLLAIGNIAVTALLVVAAHEKSSKLLKIYNKCAYGAAIATFIFYTSYLIGVMPPHYSYYMFRREYYTSVLLGGLFFTAMQLYIIAIVRSKIKKLDGNTEGDAVDDAEDEKKSVSDALNDACNEPEVIVVKDEKHGSKIEVNK